MSPAAASSTDQTSRIRFRTHLSSIVQFTVAAVHLYQCGAQNDIDPFPAFRIPYIYLLTLHTSSQNCVRYMKFVMIIRFMHSTAVRRGEKKTMWLS